MYNLQLKFKKFLHSTFYIVHSEGGQVLMLAIFAMMIVLFSVLFIISGAQIYYQNTAFNIDNEKALALAEAGIDKAIAALNDTSQNYNGEAETALGGGSYSVTMTNVDDFTKLIQSTGYLPNMQKPKLKKTIKAEVTNGTIISLNQAIRTGEGGLTIGKDNNITGLIYSNGDITLGTNTTITGNVYVVSKANTTADQSNACVGLNCTDFIFGKVSNGETHLDVAQSFSLTDTKSLNKVMLNLKKSGSPSNITVRILADVNSHPDKNVILATGTLAANSILSGGSDYTSSEIVFSPSPKLLANTVYWVMLDTTLDPDNYWSWQLDSAAGYTSGSPSWSADWRAQNPTWTVIPGDFVLKIYTEGVQTAITGADGSKVSGDVYSPLIDNLTIQKNAYYQNIISSTVKGVSHPDFFQEPIFSQAISDEAISSWKTLSSSPLLGSSVTEGDDCSLTLGPGKISGNVTVGDNCTVTVQSPVWVTGNINIGSNTTFKLDSSVGLQSGLVIVDGKVNLGAGSDFKGSSSAGSFLVLLSTYDSTVLADQAIDIHGPLLTGIIYAPKGIVSVGASTTLKAITGWKVILANSDLVSFDSKLSNIILPLSAASYSIVKGTYQVK